MKALCLFLMACWMVAALTACQTTSLQGGANIGYQRYLRVENHKAFAVIQTNDGGYAWSFVSKRNSRREAFNEAKENCRETAKKYALGECEIYDVDGIRLASLQKQQIEAILDETSIANKAGSRDVVMDLEGTWGEKTVRGTLVSRRGKGSGPISIEVDGDVCQGNWQYVKGQYNTATLPEGTWSALCSGERAASGTYRSEKEGYGHAIGTDINGRAIKMMYQLKPKSTSLKTGENDGVLQCERSLAVTNQVSKEEAINVCRCAGRVYGERLESARIARQHNQVYKPDFSLNEEMAQRCPNIYEKWKLLRDQAES